MTNPQGTGSTLSVSTLGWFFQNQRTVGGVLGTRDIVQFSAMLSVVLMSSLADIMPLPGSVGGIETVLVAILPNLPSIAIGLETALAAVVISHGGLRYHRRICSKLGRIDAFGTTTHRIPIRFYL